MAFKMAALFAAYAVVLYSLGLRACFYVVLIRFTDVRKEWYPEQEVQFCCTEARNSLGVLNMIAEVVDAALSWQCLPELYLLRRAVGDAVTLGRFAGHKRTQQYGLALLTGLAIWACVTCGKEAIGAGIHVVVNLLIQIKRRPKKKQVWRQI